MKNILFFLIQLLIVFPQPHLFAQLDDITRLPVQNIADTFSESAPVMLSDSEIIIFCVNSTQDTIFSTTSRDGGNNWETPNPVQAVELGITQSYFHLTALRSTSERIFVAWSVKYEGMFLIYSDDKGITWSQPQLILGGNIPAWQKKAESLNLSQLDDGKVLLSFNPDNERVLYLKESNDDGVTWSEEAIEVYRSQFNVNDLTVVNSTGQNLIAVFKGKPWPSSGIYKLISSDNGLTWSDTIKIVNTELNESRPKIVKRSDGSLLLTYLREDSTQISNFNQDDIYYVISSDGGETWLEEKRFTKYIGNDDFLNISNLNGKTFISFASERFTNNFQISYGILEQTLESYTPPYIYDYILIYREEEPTAHATYRARIIDDDVVQNVEVSYEESFTTTKLYDDGLHDDLEPNDNVWGNMFAAETDRNTNAYQMSVNKIILPFSNKGILADTRATVTGPSFTKSTDTEDNSLTIYTPTARYTSSQGKFEEGSFLFSGGFWLSGYNGNELWSNAVASASLVEDYLPGKVDSEPEDNLNVIYTVNKDDTPFGTSWDRWKDAVSQGADFYDGDKDGIYNPVDRNWNGTWDPNEDMPALVGDITSWCVYNDAIPAGDRRWDTVEPQGVEIQQTLFASSLPELENVIFIKYSILNTGSVNNVMDSVYFGFWQDPDIGDASNDIAGCDTILNSGYLYNYEDDYYYGHNPPAFFTSLLQGPVVTTTFDEDTAYIKNGILLGEELIPGAENLNMKYYTFYLGGVNGLSDPYNEEQARNYLTGLSQFGDEVDPCTFYFGYVTHGVNCDEVNPGFWLSGDPVIPEGWIGISSGDTRHLISTGPFLLAKDKPVVIIGAMVIGRGIDPLNSITVARENVIRAIAEYESNFASMTYTSPPATNPVTDYLLYHNYPNPFNPTTTIRYEIPLDGVVTIDIYDILGQRVRTIINEFQKADRYEIDFNGIGLASGVYIYRMKVNDFIESKKMVLLK